MGGWVGVEKGKIERQADRQTDRQRQRGRERERVRQPHRHRNECITQTRPPLDHGLSKSITKADAGIRVLDWLSTLICMEGSGRWPSALQCAGCRLMADQVNGQRQSRRQHLCGERFAVGVLRLLKDRGHQKNGD